jgi:hypothetical protein
LWFFGPDSPILFRDDLVRRSIGPIRRQRQLISVGERWFIRPPGRLFVHALSKDFRTKRQNIGNQPFLDLFIERCLVLNRLETRRHHRSQPLCHPQRPAGEHLEIARSHSASFR